MLKSQQQIIADLQQKLAEQQHVLVSQQREILEQQRKMYEQMDLIKVQYGMLFDTVKQMSFQSLQEDIQNYFESHLHGLQNQVRNHLQKSYSVHKVEVDAKVINVGESLLDCGLCESDEFCNFQKTPSQCEKCTLCPAGFFQMAECSANSDRICQDRDECTESPSICGERIKCLNTPVLMVLNGSEEDYELSGVRIEQPEGNFAGEKFENEKGRKSIVTKSIQAKKKQRITGNMEKQMKEVDICIYSIQYKLDVQAFYFINQEINVLVSGRRVGDDHPEEVHFVSQGLIAHHGCQMQKHIIQLGKYIYAFLKGIWILQLLSPPGAEGIVWLKQESIRDNLEVFSKFQALINLCFKSCGSLYRERKKRRYEQFFPAKSSAVEIGCLSSIESFEQTEEHMAFKNPARAISGLQHTIIREIWDKQAFHVTEKYLRCLQ
ncbi:hypothetical protein IHE44_0000181 [Lamprotornis superbus]|uniref:TNFR-Cys domain-containing protein n=1 Tax=Lamprotornis superbus TaxID=245042 RepID=A0A835P3U4_9PASS|nr:hypothetical protein IHE44_0000181 [Lamprotornis superbus]